MPKKSKINVLKPPAAPDFKKLKKAKPLKFPRSRYMPLHGPIDKKKSHMAAYAFMVILLSIFILGIQFSPLKRETLGGMAYTSDPDNDEDLCLYVLEQTGGCPNDCYDIPFDIEQLSISYNPKCCGDDALEFATYFNVYSEGDDVRNEFSVGAEDNPSDIACCKQDSDCVYQSACLPEDTVIDIDGDGVKGEVCRAGKWVDIDGVESICYSMVGTYVARSGENHAFGEYDQPYSTECCGDDAGEFRKGGTYCCDDVDDRIVNGQCVNS